MKAFRLWLLLLVAVLIPIRGALAVGMLCGEPAARAAQAQAQPHAHGHHAGHGAVDAPGHHDPAMHGHGDDAGHDHAGAADKCNLCAASCAAAGLVSTPVTLAGLQPAPTVFPRVHAPPPSFVSGGQERPPRST